MPYQLPLQGTPHLPEHSLARTHPRLLAALLLERTERMIAGQPPVATIRMKTMTMSGMSPAALGMVDTAVRPPRVPALALAVVRGVI